MSLKGQIDLLATRLGAEFKSIRNFISGAPSYSIPTGIVRSQRYSIERGIYNYKGSNTRVLEQGLARAMVGGITQHLVIGDSGSSACVSAVGTPMLFARDKAWPLAMRDQMSKDGVPANGTGLIKPADGTATKLDTRWAFSGTWSNQKFYALTTSAAATATCTVDRAGTLVDVWYLDGTNTVFTVSVNGAASGTGFATVTANGSAAWRKIRLSGLNVTKNSTVKIAITTIGSGLRIAGVSVSSPGSGLVIHNLGFSGARAGGSTGGDYWTDTSAGPGGLVNGTGIAGKRRVVTNASSTAASSTLTSATGAFTSADIGVPLGFVPSASGVMWGPTESGADRSGEYHIGAILSSTTVAVHQMVNGVSTAVPAAMTLSGQTVNIDNDPHCVHIELGLNDLSNGRTPAQVVTDVTTIRNWFPDSDCILHLVHEMNYTFVAQSVQQDFWQRMYALAETLDVPLYDWRDRVGTYAQGQANGVYGDVNVHLTAATYADIGASLAVLIGGGSAKGQNADVPTVPHDNANKEYIDNKVRSTGTLLAASALTTAETVAMQLLIPANTFKVGTTIDVRLVHKSALASVPTVRVRIGTAGTTADACVQSVGVGTSNTNTQVTDGLSIVNAIGTAATHIGTGTVAVGTASNVPTAAPATSGTFDSTKDNYVTVTIQNGTSTTTTLYAGRLEVNI